VLAIGPITTSGIARVLNWRQAEAFRVTKKLVEIGIAETAVAPFEFGMNRWFRLSPAAEPLRLYLQQAAGPYRRSKERLLPPPIWESSQCRDSDWRAIARTERLSAHVLEILTAVAQNIGDEYAIARRLNVKAQQIRPILSRLQQMSFLSQRDFANEPYYCLSSSLRGRALRTLLETA
jgi:hypothetical protein